MDGMTNDRERPTEVGREEKEGMAAVRAVRKAEFCMPKPEEPGAQLGESDTWADKLQTLVRQNKIAAISAVVIVLMILAAVFAPLVAPYDHLAQSLTDRLQDPSAAHWLGTDELGRDVLSRIIFGARISLTVGLVPTLISMAIGTILGLCAGFYGGKTDFIIMRLADVMLAFPSLLLAMVVMYTMGGGLINIFIALSLVAAETS